MLERMHESADFTTIDDDVGMHAACFVARLVFAKQADQARSVPAAVADRMAEKEELSSQRIAVAERIGGKQPTDFTGQIARDTLVGINDQNPFVAGLGNGPVFEVRRVDIFALDDAAVA